MSQGNPPQRQSQPGRQHEMQPEPRVAERGGRGSGRLDSRIAIITGGDSGIGRSVAMLYAREGADVAVVYLEEHDDAKETARLVEDEGGRCLLLAGDVGDEGFCADVVHRTIDEFGHLDILVNNAAEQHVRDDVANISTAQLERTFRTNVFAMFHLVKAAVPHLREGAAIINSTSVTAYQGNPLLVDYSATKGAIVAFTRALSQQLIAKGIRVNAVAPGPIWTPLIPATFPPDAVESFGTNTPIGRPGQPDEVAPCYVFLASDDASYMAGQVLHPNGGQVVNG